MSRGYPGTTQPHGTVARYKSGCHCKPCTIANRRYHTLRMMSGQPRRIDSTGTARRMRALVALGWGTGKLARELGVSTCRARQLLAQTSPTAELATARRVADLYDRLSMTTPTPTSQHDKAGITQARNTARRKGWAAPLAWDEAAIDDPDAQPQGVGYARPPAVDIDEWSRLVTTGEDPTRAARRLGVTVSAIAQAAHRHGRHDIAAAAMAAHGRNRRTAA